MAFLALLIGVVILVAAIRGTQGNLISALGQDVPEFAVWAGAIFAVAVVGYIPGLKPVSRGLLALIILVIVLTNYEAILAGFQNAFKKKSSGSGSGATFDFSNLLSDVEQSGGQQFQGAGGGGFGGAGSTGSF